MRSRRRCPKDRRTYRTPIIEWLEPRVVLAAPTLAPLGDVTLLSGAPLHVALDGFDADGDTLTYQVSTSNVQLSNPSVADPQLTTTVLEGNRSMRIAVEGYGDMLLELFEQTAPRTTARIIELAESGFYDGLIFHRVIEDFMIQGGDPLGTGTGGSGVNFDDEFHPDLQHTSSGILSMAKGDDDTNDSQFFITAKPTRWLDFNHSVFGFLVEGDHVRQQIEAVATDSDDKPLTDVVMTSVTIETDYENGVLMLKAPEGTTGSADVTVTVSDGQGGTAQRTFHVTIAQDTSNAPPYLLPIAPIKTAVNAPVTVTLQAHDIEGDPVRFDAYVPQTSPGLEVSIDAETGKLTVTPVSAQPGVYAILVGVQSAAGSDWDVQAVPVYLHPLAPTSIELLTHASGNDRLTYLNNTPGNELGFRVFGVRPGALVSLYADGQWIGQATATSSSVTLATNGTVPLADGIHQITAIQTLEDEPINVGNLKGTVDLDSKASPSLAITVDSGMPTFTSTPVTVAAEGSQYTYDVQTAEEAGGGVSYALNTAPAGMTIDPDTGVISWTPSDSQAGVHAVVVAATRTAGGTATQAFEITVRDAPILAPIASRSVDEGALIHFTASASGGEGELRFGLDQGAPAGATIDPTTGEFAWQTGEVHGPGQYSITVRVTDANGAADAETFVVSVAEVNQPPVLEDVADRSIDEGQLLAFDAVASDPDLPPNTLTFSLGPGAPEGATIDPSTGRFTWTPGESHGGEAFSVTIRVSDGIAAPVEKSFVVTVVEVNNAPRFDPVDPPKATPGETYQLTVTARDDDGPGDSYPVVYRLDSAPDGARIDAHTGRITWDVPLDATGKSTAFTVRATEDVPDGREPLSSTLTFEVEVDGADFRALALFLLETGVPVSFPAAAASDSTDFGGIAGLAGGLPAGSVGGEAGLGARDDFLSAVDPLGNPAVFGFQLGVGTGNGGVKVPEFKVELEPFGGPSDRQGPEREREQNDEASRTAPPVDDALAEVSDAAIELLAGEDVEEVEPDESPDATAEVAASDQVARS